MKLESIGVQGQVLHWIETFLTGRRHRVSLSGGTIRLDPSYKWNSTRSFSLFLYTRGPMCWKIVTNYLPTIHNYTDQSYRKQSLQSDIDNLMEWSSSWQLPFQETKCKRLHIGRGMNPQTYHMNNHILENVPGGKDLGVIVDDKLKFHTHMSLAVNSILGLIKRSFSVKDKITLPYLYISMVRPQHEYGNIVWGPHFKGDMKAIESVRKRATRMVPALKDLHYTERHLTYHHSSTGEKEVIWSFTTRSRLVRSKSVEMTYSH